MSMQYVIRLPILVTCVLLTACASTRSAEQSRMLELADDIAAHGDYATAASMYERAAETSGSDVDIQVRLGDARLAGGDFEGALHSYRAALAADINNGPALLGMGTAQLRLGQVESAERNLRRAAPEINTPAAWSRLGAALALMGKEAEAVTAFSHAVELKPNDPDVQTNLAVAEVLAGQSGKAMALMREVTASPLAEQRHFRGLLLVLVMAGEDSLAQSTDIPDMPAEQRQSLIAHAQQIRDIGIPSEQARAIGLARNR